jgi:uncharacterized protein (DUF1800 family)
MSTYTQSAAQAFNRFGFGGRPDDPVPADPMAWLANQITCADTAPAPGGSLPTLSQALTMVNNWLTAPFLSAQSQADGILMWNAMNAETQSFLANAITTKIPFRERLTWFWSNHYAVMAGANGAMLALSGTYVRDAIRANMTGTVAQMLQATALHPAMIYSLNANISVGPLSALGIIHARNGNPVTINENLAREILELYSVGINAGYTQADVDALAFLLSGIDVNLVPGSTQGTIFNPQKQQPGNFTLMGITYPGTQAGLMSALQMLGTHPCTYAHLATKLVAHFTSDTPAAADVAVVTAALANSGGSLPAAHQAIIGLQNAWVPFQKLRTPADLLVAAARAGNVTAANMPSNLNYWVTVMGQQTWCPPFPNGWSDAAGPWTGPGPALLRARWGNFFAGQVTATAPAQALSASIGPLMTANSLNLIHTSTVPHEQMTMLFGCPEFQRR